MEAKSKKNPQKTQLGLTEEHREACVIVWIIVLTVMMRVLTSVQQDRITSVSSNG